MKIDLVYLWVDGSDPAWRARKKAFLTGETCVLEEADNEARFFNNDELMYSVRSVCRYAPWINHIYIVTDNQVPEWLDRTNPKITIVDHREIIPHEGLPCYSSPAIEWCIDNIKGLSEYFLLANDDFFIAQPVTESFFYNEQGYPIVRLKRQTGSRRRLSLYMKTILKAQSLIRERYGVFIKYVPHHNIDAYRLSDFKECKQQFQPLVDKTVNAHFRQEEDLQRVAVLYYALVKGHGQLKVMGRYNRSMPWFRKLTETLHNRFYYDSRTLALWKCNFDKVLRKYHPILFCMNDTEKTEDRHRRMAKDFLEKLFPEKCEFER